MQNKYFHLNQLLVDRLRLILPYNKLESVLHTFTVRRPTTIRANTLKISGPELRRELLDLGIKADTVFWNKEAFIIRNKTLREIEELDFYKKGYFYVQSLSSMIPPIVLDPKPNEKVLDIAAAPGSKTTQMAAMMGNTGEIIANEPNPVRMQKLKANLTIQGITNTKIIGERGEILDRTYREYFDKVLVDAPCSGEGRICSFYPDSYKFWSLRHISNFAHLQKSLLLSALSAVKPGGRIVYSTCTLAPEENEEVVDFILQREKGKVMPERISVGTFQFASPILKWGEKIYSPQIGWTARILPGKEMEGFFVAVIKKLS